MFAVHGAKHSPLTGSGQKSENRQATVKKSKFRIYKWYFNGAKHSPLTALGQKHWNLQVRLAVTHFCNLVRSTLPWRPNSKIWISSDDSGSSIFLQFINGILMVRSTLPWRPNSKNLKIDRWQWHGWLFTFYNRLLNMRSRKFSRENPRWIYV